MAAITRYASPQDLIDDIGIQDSIISSVGKVAVDMPQVKYRTGNERSKVYVYADEEEQQVGKIDFTEEKAVIRPMSDMRKVIATVQRGDN